MGKYAYHDRAPAGTRCATLAECAGLEPICAAAAAEPYPPAPLPPLSGPTHAMLCLYPRQATQPVCSIDSLREADP